MEQMNSTPGTNPEMETPIPQAEPSEQNEIPTAFATGMTVGPVEDSTPDGPEAAQEENGEPTPENGAVDDALYEKYGLKELDEYIKDIENLSYLELVSLRNQMHGNIERIESCKTAMDQLKSAAVQLNSAAAMANCLDHYGIDLTADEFYEMYDLYMPKMKQITDLCSINIKGIGPRANSTKYMTGNMILVLEKRLFSLDSTDAANASRIKELTTNIDIYKNRTDFTWIGKKLTNMIQNKKQLRLMAKALTSGTVSDIFGTLAQHFAPVNLGGFVTYLQDRLEYEDGDILALLYCLNRILDVKASGGEETWVKVFVLNISDIMGNIYDLKVTADELQESLDSMLNKLLPQATQYLFGTRKIKINASIMDFYHKLREKYIEAINAENAKLKAQQEAEAEDAAILEGTDAVGRGMTHPVMYDAPAEGDKGNDQEASEEETKASGNDPKAVQEEPEAPAED